MYIVGQFLMGVAQLFNMICNVLYFLLVIRIILSWFSISPYNEVVQVLYRVTDPILAPFRRLPLRLGMIDFSPILAFMALYFIRDFVVGILSHYAITLMR